MHELHELPCSEVCLFVLSVYVPVALPRMSCLWVGLQMCAAERRGAAAVLVCPCRINPIASLPSLQRGVDSARLLSLGGVLCLEWCVVEARGQRDLPVSGGEVTFPPESPHAVSSAPFKVQSAVVQSMASWCTGQCLWGQFESALILLGDRTMVCPGPCSYMMYSCCTLVRLLLLDLTPSWS